MNCKNGRKEDLDLISRSARGMVEQEGGKVDERVIKIVEDAMSGVISWSEAETMVLDLYK